jgi:[ribosomal protein S5]-alanine N-acetyltransferase
MNESRDKEGNMLDLLPPNINVVIRGRSIIMRPIEIDDIGEKYVSWLNDPEINQFLEVSKSKKQTVKDVFEYVNHRRSEGTEVFGILTNHDNMLVGTTGLINWEKKIEYQKILNLKLIKRDLNSASPPLGFGLMIGDKKAQMLGVGGEAYLYMISLIFDFLKADIIFNMAVLKYIEVISMAERVGFNKIHTLSNHIELSSGKYHGVILTMTQNEWLIKKKRFRLLLDKLKIKSGE